MSQGFDGELIFNTRVDTRGFTQGANTVRSQADGLRSALAGLAKYFSVAFIIGGLVKLGKQAVETASDLQEVQNVVDTAFGSMANKIENFSKSCVKMYGISELTAKQTASTFMSMGAGMDIAAESASNMAVNLTGRMGDMMSFFNQTSEITSTALNGIYTGETEALKKFGVVMTEANLQQYAYQQGITKAISKMSQAEKVTLRYNFVMEKTALSQGDFAKTSDSWANSTRVLKEEFKSLLGTVGNGLIQLLIPALRAINGILSSLVGLANTVSAIFSDVFGTTKNIYTVTNNTSDATESASDGLSDLGDTVDKTSKSINRNMAPFDELNQISSDLADNTGKIDLGGVSNGLDTVADTTEGSNKLADTVKDAKDGIDGLGLAIIGLGTAFTVSKVASLITKLITSIGMLSTNPVGLVAIAVGALAMLGVALYELWRQAKLEDLNERFGDVTLSIEEMRDVAQSILDNGTMEKLGIVSAEWADLDGIQEEIQGAVDTLNKLNWKVGIGMELTEQEQEQYKQAINTYIEKTQQYASEQKEAVLLSLDFMLSDGAEKENLMSKTQLFYNGIEGELKTLGTQLSEAVSQAWEDGLFTIDEAKKVQEIQTQMSNIQMKLAASTYQAKLQQINISYSGVELTPETYKSLEAEINSATQEYMSTYDEAELNLLASLNLQLDEGSIDEAEFDKAVDDITKNKLNREVEVTLNATRFSVATFTDAFEVEIGESVPKMQKVVEKNVSKWFDENLFENDMQTFFESLAEELDYGYGDLDSVVVSNMNDLLEYMRPNKERWEEIKADCVKKGIEIPKSVSNGLSAIHQLEALTGDVDAIYYLIGTQIGKSPEYTATMQKALKAGKWVPQKVIDGMNSKDEKLSGSVEEMFALLGMTTEEQSEFLKGLTGKVGEDAAQALADKIKAKIPSVKQATMDLLNTIKDNIKNAKMPDITLKLQTAKQFNDTFYNPLSVNGYATGTVVPANYGKFLGVLGDSPATEVVSPLPTMKQAFKEALSEMGNIKDSGIAHYTINLNGRSLIDGLIEADEERSKSTGSRVLYR